MTGNWEQDPLRDFLLNPGEFAPGTTMPPTILDRRHVNALIAFLEAR